MYFAYITARVHQMIMQQWHAATTPGTVTHSRISSLLISRRLTRPRVASRYSVRPEGSATRASAYEISKSTGFHVDFGFQSGFLDFTVDFWISVWISGFQFGFLPTGFFLYVLGYFSYSSQLSKKGHTKMYLVI